MDRSERGVIISSPYSSPRGNAITWLMVLLCFAPCWNPTYTTIVRLACCARMMTEELPTEEIREEVQHASHFLPHRPKRKHLKKLSIGSTPQDITRCASLIANAAIVDTFEYKSRFGIGAPLRI